MADEPIITPTPELIKEGTKAASLKDAIKAAVKDTPIGKTEPEPEVKTEPEVKVKDEPKDELSEEQRSYAVNLYKALSNPDPKLQRSAFEILAKSAGLEIKDIETKKELKEAKKDLTALLKEGLGEFDFLADKLGPVLDKILKEAINENTNDIREKQNLNEREREEARVNDAIGAAFEQYTLDENQKSTLVKEMENLMDSFVPSKKTTHEQYFKALIRLAADNKNINLKSSNTQVLTDKIIKNRNDAAGRLASARGAEVKDVVRTTEFKSLKDAIKDAMNKANERK